MLHLYELQYLFTSEIVLSRNLLYLRREPSERRWVLTLLDRVGLTIVEICESSEMSRVETWVRDLRLGRR
ncbi:hypothetical protein TREMEDRAFT_68096 [Tremella mesenterica DSM 1558]|uniref:uncharacterized protein n=1 Tax=Tremella mesenterica (strain ATCC 24925 / CBS 8224 / DSM 1558 / NBRC 9311 / NRRL Y-6157 / RJB 2259-6 / UBC 559-6) TaxID=578456 RepID=UPI0003F4A5D5|nr:uncharacterized protein TREMEDRAFT_68096 [Tremella mesenterica DSM 1558]EIW70510.1 hypothetical protein TREMEDRAFT_68096 [Tremella mesenterica DSM 1558]